MEMIKLNWCTKLGVNDWNLHSYQFLHAINIGWESVI